MLATFSFRNYMRFIALILILICQSFAAFSQTATNSVKGSVIDELGAVISQARITATLLSEVESNSSRSFKTKTDDEGNFILSNLLPGEYKLSVTTGFSSETEKLISISQNKSVEVKIVIGSGCDRLSEGSGFVTDEDKAEIVKLALADTVKSGSGLLMPEQEEKGIVVSTENIKPEWLKGITEIKLKVMSQSQVQQRADRGGDFLYVSFSTLKVSGLCVVIEVANTWAVGKNSKFVYLSGGGNRYEFRKASGKWIKKSIGGWVS